MNRIWLGAMSVAVGCAMTAAAEPARTLLVNENKTPDKGKLEVGGIVSYQEITDNDSMIADASYSDIAPYARYGITKDFSLNAELPFARSDMGNDDAIGLGDLVLGADLVGFEDALGYPYVMPYLRLALPTGDDSDGLGAGETRVKLGASIGTTVDDDWDFVADVGFIGRSETDNSFAIGAAVVYNFTKQFSLHAEGRFEVASEDDMDDIGTILGGMVYRPADGWMIGLYGGMESGDIDDNVIGAAKLAYAWE